MSRRRREGTGRGTPERGCSTRKNPAARVSAKHVSEFRRCMFSRYRKLRTTAEAVREEDVHVLLALRSRMDSRTPNKQPSKDASSIHEPAPAHSPLSEHHFTHLSPALQSISRRRYACPSSTWPPPPSCWCQVVGGVRAFAAVCACVRPWPLSRSTLPPQLRPRQPGSVSLSELAQHDKQLYNGLSRVGQAPYNATSAHLDDEPPAPHPPSARVSASFGAAHTKL